MNYFINLKVEYTYPKNMDLSKIKNDLQQVLQLVEDWREKGVNELERDLALGMLREIYSDVRFGAAPQPETITPELESETVSPSVDAVEPPLPEVEQLPMGIAISLDDVFEGFVPEDLMPVGAAMPIEEKKEEEPASEIEGVGEECPSEPQSAEESESNESEVAEPDPQPETTEEIAPEIAEPEKVEEQALESPKQPTTAEPVMGQASLFGDDILFAPRPSRRTKMMSLYDDEPRNEVTAPKSAPESQPEVPVAQPQELSVEVLEEDEEFTEVDVATMPVEEPQPEESVMPESAEVVAESEPEHVPDEPYVEPQIEVTMAAPVSNLVPESEPVLGEVLKSDVQTIADTIQPKDTAAEQIVKGSVDDITKAVGINDRFLLIRDLFGGSSSEYEKTMAELNSFDNLEDCMIHIIENYDWNPNSDGAKLMMELIERKYS